MYELWTTRTDTQKSLSFSSLSFQVALELSWFFLKKPLFHLPPRLFDRLLFPLPLPPSLFDSPLSPGVNLLFSFRGEEEGLTLVFLPYLRKTENQKWWTAENM